jgi:hypothetical protein|tara:strand:- start:7794 stop:8450 length:657 start_codon:yes stop_codon:yes gene_type:complete
MFLKTCNKEFVENFIESQPEGKNTKFLKASHNLWFRFKNYDKQPPYVLLDEEDPVAFVFATFSKRSRYINLYEIVTAEGQEGNGYASEAWERVMQTAYDSGMERLKISCTPSSVTWHKRNGLIFWAVDPTGSLRSDQPLFPNIHEQNTFRELAIKDPSLALPKDKKVIDQLTREGLASHGFGAKKTATVDEAIQNVGEYWFRDTLMQCKPTSLEDFFE